MKRLATVFAAVLLILLTGMAHAWGPWQSGSAMSAAFYIEQRQWPAGYGIRLFIPDRRTADIHVSVKGSNLLIRSEQEEQLAPRGTPGPVFMQFGSFSQWLSLPSDANMSQMKLTSQEGVINIFIPRKPSNF